MLTKNEISTLNLSPTKKDFVQIWNELLEISSKLSERWDPTSTNESDPGIVILKALTGIADKLNYNIDKNTLEAFMPTAAQEDSMRKLCDMLGYTMKYYQSAKTDVVIKYYNSDPSVEEQAAIDKGLLIPKFTVITNTDQDISYFTTNQTPVYITSTNPSCTIECMEGQLVKCESINDNYSITVNQISENNRFYLPETQIAENGIFIYNIFYNEQEGNEVLSDGTPWEKVDNLNTQPGGSRVYKFGFDSYEGRPYIEFPEDYSELFSDGLFIYYTRTNGTNGNISSHTLTQLEVPTLTEWSEVSSESFTADNIFAASTGANPETIQQAYNNFKKTIGTFDTLVTCRDYMNKVYTMLDSNGKPYLSNALVTDIRNDLNKAITICSCDDAGIFYKETPLVLKANSTVTNENTKPVFDTNAWYLGSADGLKLTNKTNLINGDSSNLDLTKSGEVSINKDGYWVIIQNGTSYNTKLYAYYEVDKPAIDHFDLILYPFKSYTQIKNNVEDIGKVYDASFAYSDISINEVINKLKDSKVNTIAHNIKTPEVGDIISINNYLRLNATIATNNKITVEEGTLINENIKVALANAFNMHELDFGEEIPFDSIVEVIEQSDSRIRVASLNEPALYTTYSVIKSIDKGIPKIVEYAVASDWLSVEDGENDSRFTYTEIENGDEVTHSSFNTEEAKAIFNKLAIRNVLAGRVPLFKYNNTFKTSFSEGPYQITTEILAADKPEQLAVPDDKNPKTIWTDGTDIYLGYLEEGEPIYNKVSTPLEFSDSVVAPTENENLTDISTSCKLTTNNGSTFSELKLGAGEFVKFRAPNFTTVKTYPAYVNYHLAMDKALIGDALPAEADSLFAILDEDRTKWSSSNTQIRWQKVLDYFGNLDATNKEAGNETEYKKTFTLEQKISKFSEAASTGEDICSSNENPTGQHVRDEATGKCKYCGVTMMSEFHKGPIVVKIKSNKTSSEQEYTPEQLLNFSGCIKLTNNNFKARLAWTDEDGDVIPNGEVPLEIQLDLESPFITSYDLLTNIQDYVNNTLDEFRSKVSKETNKPILPTACAWKIFFDFECVPFIPASLNEWEKFIRYCASNFNTSANNYSNLLSFKPVDENNIVLWRLFGEGYDIGKYVTNDSEKLLAFDKNYFGLLPTSYLHGIYLVKNIGKNAQPAIINNDEEYQLKANEYLYIEYTPSSTTADGTTQDAEAVTEIHGPGTIIKPKGFELGIMDSDIYTQLGTSAHKTVTFELSDKSHRQIPMHRFGANEQVEIRDFAKVTLSKNTFKSSPEVWIYKNFNGCDELEKGIGFRTYTLKDGEYIFYTDKNKTELAFFTSGTQVSLEGSVKIPTFDIIDIATIFDSGIEKIPFKYLTLSNDASVTFQEYQYITLGSGDTVKNIQLASQELRTIVDENNNELVCIDDTWQKCKSVEYTIASDPTKVITLPKISVIDYTGELVTGDDNGWDVSSTLELDVSSSNSQILRKIENENGCSLSTSIEITKRSTGGADPKYSTFAPVAKEYPVAFKTNLICRTSSNNINIDDVYYNSKKLKSFQLKFFAEHEPLIVKTMPGEVIPFDSNDFCNWTGETLNSKSYLDIWNQVGLDKIRENIIDLDDKYDNALRLSACVSSNTYGIFSIYLQYTDGSTSNNRTWLQVVPGTDKNAISIFNSDECLVDNKLYLHPGINTICINKTCSFFIKTLNNSQGTVFFDDLRLVDCANITYQVGNSDSVYEKTFGLNLEQIGFLPIANDSSEILLTESTIDKLQKQLVDDTEKTLVRLSAETNQDISDKAKELTSPIADLRILNKDMNDIFLDGTKYKNVIAVSNDLQEIIKVETDLLDALSKNSNLEDQLSAIIEQISSNEETKNKLLADIEVLKADATKAIESLTDKDIVANYTEYELSSDTLPSTWKNIITAAKELNTVDYLTKRKEVISKLEQTITDNDSEKLKELLESLKAPNRDINQINLTYLVNKLKSRLEITDLVSLINIAKDAALVPNNKGVISSLNELKATLASYDKTVILADIEAAMSSSEDTILKDLLTELSTIINNPTESFTNVLQTIDDVISYVTNLHSSETVDTKIITYLDTIITNLTTLFDSEAFDIMERIYELIQYEEGSVEQELIQTAEDVNACDTMLIKQLINEWNMLKTDYSTIKSILYSAETEIPVSNDKAQSFIDIAIASSWRAPLKAKINEFFGQLALNEFVLNPSPNCSKDNLSAIYYEKLSYGFECLETVLAIDKFSELFNDIEDLWLNEEKTDAFISDITTILNIFIDSSKINDAVQSLVAHSDNPKIKSVIKVLYAIAGSIDLTTYNFTVNQLVQNPQLFIKLKKELETSKTLNTQLLDIVRTTAYPNLASLKNKYQIYNKDAIKEEDKYVVSLIVAADEAIFGGNGGVFSGMFRQYLSVLERLIKEDFSNFEFFLNLVDESLISYLPDIEKDIIRELPTLIELKIQLDSLGAITIENDIVNIPDDISHEKLLVILNELQTSISNLTKYEVSISDEDMVTYSIVSLEKQLLEELAKNDYNNDFYYTVSIEPHMAIYFIESDKAKNTLLNPSINYDINNVNNSFVISKLDINHLTDGIQLARSSRLN